MPQRLEIYTSTHDDLAAIESLYPQAFPDEDLLPLVRELLGDQGRALSLVGTMDTAMVGHVLFTHCGLVGERVDAALLGPLAVAPGWQRQGIGTALVRTGLQQLARAGVVQVFVLGDPAYYRRLGFVSESAIEPPYALPAEWDGAWQSLFLVEPAVPRAGRLSVPAPWQHRALWAP